MSPKGEAVFVSTGAFKNWTLTGILEWCAVHDYCGLELSSGFDFFAKKSLIQAWQSGQRFLIHNYYPPPANPFVLNLASSNKQELDETIKLCQMAIDLCAELGIDFYSVHAGFCYHADPSFLGRKQTQQDRFPKENALDIFVESVRRLADYGAQKGVCLLVENNVAEPINLVDGRNELFLGVTLQDFQTIFSKINRNNTGLLLDIGHLNVSARSLNFSPETFISELASSIKAIHLSENDGIKDSNMPIRKDSWFWKPLLNINTDELTWILEVYNLSPGQLADQVGMISQVLNT